MAARKPGRPARAERVFTGAQLEKLRVQWLQGWSVRKMALAAGCTPAAIHHHLHHQIIPAERAAVAHRRHEIIAKVDHLYAVAWDRFEASLEPTTMNEIRKTVEGALRERGEKKEDAGQIVTEIERITRRTGEATWLAVIQWCLDWYSRVGGYYAAQRVEGKVEFRVAGKSPEEVDREMLSRLRKQVEARQRFSEELLAGRVSGN